MRRATHSESRGAVMFFLVPLAENNISRDEERSNNAHV